MKEDRLKQPTLSTQNKMRIKIKKAPNIPLPLLAELIHLNNLEVLPLTTVLAYERTIEETSSHDKNGTVPPPLPPVPAWLSTPRQRHMSTRGSLQQDNGPPQHTQQQTETTAKKREPFSVPLSSVAYQSDAQLTRTTATTREIRKHAADAVAIDVPVVIPSYLRNPYHSVVFGEQAAPSPRAPPKARLSTTRRRSSLWTILHDTCGDVLTPAEKEPPTDLDDPPTPDAQSFSRVLLNMRQVRLLEREAAERQKASYREGQEKQLAETRKTQAVLDGTYEPEAAPLEGGPPHEAVGSPVLPLLFSSKPPKQRSLTHSLLCVEQGPQRHGSQEGAMRDASGLPTRQHLSPRQPNYLHSLLSKSAARQQQQYHSTGDGMTHQRQGQDRSQEDPDVELGHRQPHRANDASSDTQTGKVTKESSCTSSSPPPPPQGTTTTTTTTAAAADDDRPIPLWKPWSPPRPLTIRTSPRVEEAKKLLTVKAPQPPSAKMLTVDPRTGETSYRPNPLRLVQL